MGDIFLSYARVDRAAAAHLVEELERHGWSVWWDRNIVPGTNFDKAIEKELEAARCVIVLWSATSVLSDWVRAEAAEAASRHALIPVLIDDVKMPLEFRRLQTLSLFELREASPRADFRELLKAVAYKLPRPAEGEASGRPVSPGPTSSSAVETPAERARLRLHYPGGTFLWEVKLEVFLDGQPVGFGFIKKGIDLPIDTTVGAHRLEVKHYFAKNPFDLELSSPGLYELELRYTGGLRSFEGTFRYVGELQK